MVREIPWRFYDLELSTLNFIRDEVLQGKISFDSTEANIDQHV
jgi:hypothetical protein